LRSKWTRSSPFVADPLDPGPLGFAHRGLHYGPEFPENTLLAFAAALELGAGIECDLRLTADDQIIIFHDADASRLCASGMRIGGSTLNELGRLQLAGGPIPTLESVLALVAGRVPLLLEVKTDRDLWRWIPALRRELAGYAGRFGVMSFDPRIPRLLKTNMPEVRRGLILRASTPPIRRRLFLHLAGPDFLALQLAGLGQPWVAKARRGQPLYTWTVRTPAERAQAAVQADALIWEADGRP
jgi:glycerophosphoryl diester phosphodiesterase